MKRSILFPVLLVSIAVISTTCKTSNNTDCDNFHWGYEGTEAPVYWSTCFTGCDGEAQSPIDIRGAAVDQELSALETHYEAIPIDVENNGHTIELEYEAGSYLHFDGEDFILLQLHFHTGSEHTVNGNQYPMEVHLVHKNESTGKLAVIGIFFVEGSANLFLQNFIDNLPTTTDDHYTSEMMVNAQQLIPSDPGYYTYTGSLTTPPCSEIVTWFVMKTPIPASHDQIEKMHALVHNNFRPVQPLNGREIREMN